MYVVVRLTSQGEELVKSMGTVVRFPDYYMAHRYVSGLYLTIATSEYYWRYRIDRASDWTAELMATEIRDE